MLGKTPDGTYASTILFCGTVVLHLLVENQNRYHYHALSIFAIVAGTTISHILRTSYHYFMFKREEEDRLKDEKAALAAEIARQQETEEELADMRAKALHAQFDMGKAIKEGHIKVIASQAVADAEDRLTKE